jgi:hypothetical protein
VVDWPGELVEEPSEPHEVGGVESGDLRTQLEADAMQAIRVACGEDQVGSRGASAPRRLEPDPRTAADHDDGLPAQLRFALCGRGGVRGPHESS